MSDHKNTTVKVGRIQQSSLKRRRLSADGENASAWLVTPRDGIMARLIAERSMGKESSMAPEAHFDIAAVFSLVGAESTSMCRAGMPAAILTAGCSSIHGGFEPRFHISSSALVLATSLGAR